ncbi:Cytochrome P450 monooxygenase [Lachnellula hyalina]|uniref:Cytochrome P450 monooxygenase n=1 Tax=Lachnellula hyalina TaxID=1316788 RepID=A0A8H8RAK7_9HELO|nr:Cytochrome P450 monooxygenase [Lachnellula hyalina]TVY30728.1 Cytochrome P450 monooxygenase [Lachnellula hyalina]
MNSILLLFTAAGSALVLYCIITLLRVGRRSKDLPPGPPTIPILGNLHLLKMLTFIRYQKSGLICNIRNGQKNMGIPLSTLCKQALVNLMKRPIYSLILGTKTYIVLSTPTAVKDLLDKKSSIYSSRPDIYLGQDVVSEGRRFVTMASSSKRTTKYGPMWRSVHRMMHNTLNIQTAVAYIPYQDLENKDMMLAFLDDPKGFRKHVRRYTTSLTTQMVFGYRTTSQHDPRLLKFFENFEEWGKLVSAGSAQILDLYPILRNLPTFLAPAYKSALELGKKELDLYMQNWMSTKNRIKDGTCHPCFSYDVLKAQKNEGFSDEQAAYITGSLLEGGSDTTSGTLVGFIQAMMMFPEVQKTAQAQIDQVVGPDRLPTLDDIENLRYIQACVKETIRWMPTLIIGLPHSNIQDDEYEGYKIPNGSTIVPNNWTLNMDPKRNPNPRVFDPTRFENDFQSEKESATNKDGNQRQNWIFGSGRRLCQGMHIAERSLFMGMARMLWAYNFERVIDENGVPVPVDIDDFVGGIAVQPVDFEVNITPRSKEKADIIRNAWKNVEETLLDAETKQWLKVPPGMTFNTAETMKL